MGPIRSVLGTLLALSLAAAARDLHVDPAKGDDRNDGLAQPVKTIPHAIKLAQPGDTIHLLPTTYYDYAGFYSKQGAPGQPITLDGHGATLEGSDALDPAKWTETSPGLFKNEQLLPRLDDAMIGRWFFLWDGRMNHMGRTSKGPSAPLKKPEELQPGEWTFVKDDARKLPNSQQIFGTFYLKLPPGQALADAKIRAPVRSAGVQFSGTVEKPNAHLVIRNLTATHVYNDGYNIHGHCEDVLFENIRAIECGDDGISAHETAQYRVDGFVSIGNSTGICDTGASVTSYNRVFIRDCLGFDLYFLDTGRYSVSNAVVLSSAARTFFVTGRDHAEGVCTLLLDNVLIRRVAGDNEVRVAKNSVLTARRATFQNLNFQATGGEVALENCVITGAPPPEMLLWKDVQWRGKNNLYELGTLRFDKTVFTPKTFAEFQKFCGSEQGSQWRAPSSDAVPLPNIGADLSALESSTVPVGERTSWKSITPQSLPMKHTRRQFLRHSVAGAALSPLLAHTTTAAPAPASETRALEEITLFAFDDHSIPWRSNLHLTPVTAQKHPANPVLRCGPEGSPDHGHAIIYGTVLHIGGKFRMWYLGMIQRTLERHNAPGWWRPMCYAESDDGIHWTKPELGLVELNGSTKNNICLIEAEPHSLSRVNDFLTVIHEPDDADPQQRYKCVFIAHLPFEEVRGGRSGIGPNESRWCGFVCATSADGLRWKVPADRPANAGGERFEVAGLYRFQNFYYATGQLISPWTWRADGSDVGRVMLAYRSPDFRAWSQAKAFSFARPGQLTNPPAPGQQTHMGAGFWNRGNVLVGLYGRWQDGPKEKPKGSAHLWGTRIDLGLIVSNDGIHFREPVPDHQVIPRGADGEWDSIALTQGHAFANVGDQTMIWYGHWDCEAQFRSQEVGLATLRRDGFAYLQRHTRDIPGHFVTTLIETKSSDRRLFINIEGATPESPLVVELLDDRDQPLPDFSGAKATQITESGTRRAVTWPQALPPRYAVKVSFPAKSEARCYALYAT